MEKIIELEKEIIGKGEVKGYTYYQEFKTQYAYLYAVFNESGTLTHYEVFKRKNSPVCVDFENRVYSEDEFKESYPKSNAFGVWAWTCRTRSDADERLNKIEEKLEAKAKDIFYCNACHAMFEMECICNE